jgi:hypothetical protein
MISIPELVTYQIIESLELLLAWTLLAYFWDRPPSTSWRLSHLESTTLSFSLSWAWGWAYFVNIVGRLLLELP